MLVWKQHLKGSPDMEKFLVSRDKKMSLQKPLVMGILNVTPDSFSDGGKFKTNDEAVDFALQMVAQGADIIDLGGESTGPGSKDVSAEEELARVLPVLKLLREKIARGAGGARGAWISVDTYKAEVARAVLEAGADMINDVTALRGGGHGAGAGQKMAEVLAKFDVPVVLMYCKDATARTTRNVVEYDDVIKTIGDFFEERIAVAVGAGIARSRLVLDPGMGAFVSAEPKYSLQILRRLREFESFKLPLLVGPSRKSFIGQVLDLPLTQRLEGTLAACAVAVMNGASILRVHDVQETRRVVDMVHNIIKN